MNSKTNDSRYPYTYAADYLRGYGGETASGVKMSRLEASLVRQAVAVAIGMDDEELAKKLADYYKANEERLSVEAADRLFRAMGFGSKA